MALVREEATVLARVDSRPSHYSILELVIDTFTKIVLVVQATATVLATVERKKNRDERP